MKLSSLAIIINPVSGRKESIFTLLDKTFNQSPIIVTLAFTQKAGDEIRLALKAAASGVDAIAIWGGDSTVANVVKSLYTRHIPIIVLPGGTANVFAASLGMLPDLETNLSLVFTQRLKRKKIDMALINEKPMLHVFTAGIIARNVLLTTREAKNKLGMLAYILSSFKVVSTSKPENYTIQMGTQKLSRNLVGLFVINSGKFFIAGIPFLEGVDNTDGMVDIFAIHSSETLPLLELGASLVRNEDQIANMSHWRARDIHITVPQNEPVMIDDIKIPLQRKFKITVIPEAVDFLVP